MKTVNMASSEPPLIARESITPCKQLFNDDVLVTRAFNVVSKKTLGEQPTVRAREVFESWMQGAVAELDLQRNLIDQGQRVSPTAFLRLAQSATLVGRSKEAVSTSIRAISLARNNSEISKDPVDPAVVGGAISILLQNGALEEAERVLSELPGNEYVALLRAKVAAADERWSDILSLSSDGAARDFASLRGLAHLALGNPAKAVHELRQSLRETGARADVLINLAHAFWELGARRKAIRHALQAVAVESGRQDISIAMLTLMLAAGRSEFVLQHITELHSHGVVPVAELVEVEAVAAFQLGRHPRALTALSSAAELAHDAGDPQYEAELLARKYWMQAYTGRKEYERACAEIEELAARHPGSSALIKMIADILPDKPDVKKLRQLADRHIDVVGKDLDPALEYQLAWSECSFYEASRAADEWHRVEPLNARAASTSFLLTCLVRADMENSSDCALNAVRIFPPSSMLYNNAAFVLAMARRPDAAQAVLDRIDIRPFHLMATEGLVKLSSGRVAEGLELYRRAAELLEGQPDAEVNRHLMTAHQTMALRHLGLVKDVATPELLAQVLPAVEPPADWRDRPDFVLIYKIAQNKKWPWPMVF